MATIAAAAAASADRRAPRAHFVGRLFREKPLGALGGMVFLAFLFCGIFADLLAPYGFNQINPVNRLKPPSWAFPFGTDNLGPRHALALPLRRAALRHHRILRCGTCDAHLGRARHRHRLSRRQGRSHRPALRRCLAELPRPDRPDRGRVGGRPRHAADHRHARPAARHRRLAHHPQRRRLGAREHVRACCAIDRRLHAAHPVAPYPAQRAAARSSCCSRPASASSS